MSVSPEEVPSAPPLHPLQPHFFTELKESLGVLVQNPDFMPTSISLKTQALLLNSLLRHF